MRLISFLGTGQYQTTCYYLDSPEKSVHTPYVTLALTKLLHVQDTLVLATDKAQNTHGEALTQAFAEAGLPEPRFVPLVDGRSSQELWDNFNRLQQSLMEASDEVVLDITHGFRSQPFFAGAVVSYVRAVAKTAPAIRVVYGAFEARDLGNNRTPLAQSCMPTSSAFEARDLGNNRTPIWELTAFVDLLDWAQAIRAFLYSGEGEWLAAKAKALSETLARTWAVTRQGPPPQVKKFASALEAFSQALKTVRTGELLLARDKHPSATRWLADALAKTKDDLIAYSPPLAPILDELEQKIAALLLAQDHLAGQEGQRVMAALARLYLEFGRYAEAGIVLREGWVNLYATPCAARPGEGFDETARRHAENLLKQAGHRERELMGLRNDIEHGGFRKKPLPAGTICQQLARFVDEFAQAQHENASAPASPTTWFVSRHPGAAEWAKKQGITVDRIVDHLSVEEVKAGDTVIGTLPLNLAAQVCAKGARFLYLSLELPPNARGKELSASEMEEYGAKLEEFRVEKI